MCSEIRFVIFLLIFITHIVFLVQCHSKYSKQANEPYIAYDHVPDKNLKTLEKPFRMQKVNILWEKGQKLLDEGKLKFLYADLKIHDKEELQFKKLKADGGDKDGLKEAELIKKLNIIIYKHKLQKKMDENIKITENDNTILGGLEDANKNMFKDKKLNKLWIKAQKSGFSNLQLRALKEEFQHHQEKIDQYYYFLEHIKATEQENDMIQNSLHSIGSEDLIQSSHSRIQEKHKELRENFEYLSRQVLLGDFQFEEPEVEQLWKLAQKANFTGPELESLREELHHYENRLKKLQIFKSDIDGKISVENPEHHQFKEKRLQDYERKVNKYQQEIESRIYKKHLEL